MAEERRPPEKGHAGRVTKSFPPKKESPNEVSQESGAEKKKNESENITGDSKG